MLEHIVKKRIFFFILLNLSTFVLFAEESIIPKKYLGTYLSVDYINLFQKYKNHEKALKEIYNTHYDVLFVNETKCYTHFTHEEGSFVSTENLEKWSYKTEDNNLYITDENGYLYRRISDQISKNVFYEYVADYLFGLYPDSNIEIKDNKVKIGNTVYEIKLKPNHPREPVPEYALHLFIFDDKGLDFAKVNILDPNAILPEVYDFFLILDKDGFKIIRGKNINDRWYKPILEEVVYTYLRK